MRTLPLACAFLLLSACTSQNSDLPAPTATLDVALVQGTPNSMNVYVNVGGEGIRFVVLSRDDKNDGVAQFQTLKTVTAAPFSFSLTDQVPGYGTFTYQVVVTNGSYRTEVERTITYEVTPN